MKIPDELVQNRIYYMRGYEYEPDTGFGASVYFWLDGTTWRAHEDKSDGLRSYTEELEKVANSLISRPFPPVAVRCAKRVIRSEDTELLEITGVETKEVVLLLGTNYNDMYYPSCVMDFNPKALGELNGRVVPEARRYKRRLTLRR